MKDSEVTDIESMIEQLRAALEDAQEILEELSAFYVEVGEDIGKNEAFKEQKTSKKTYKERSKWDKMQWKSARAKSWKWTLH